MSLSFQEISRKAVQIKTRYQDRDFRYADVTAIRRGDYNEVLAGAFPEDMPKEIVQNYIDTAARDIAEMVAPLPAFNCLSSSMVADAARKRADKRSKIAANYVNHSRLRTQMPTGADRLVTFSYLPFYVEPDLDAKTPRITVETPVGGYPEINRWGEVVSFTRWYQKSVGELISEFPELTGKLRGTATGGSVQRGDATLLDMVRYCDDEIVCIFLPSQSGFGDGVRLNSYNHKLSKCPVKIVQRPQWDEQMRGQWDSVMWVQVARSRMALYALEAVDKAVGAPMMLPTDVQEVPLGNDGVIYTDHPEKAGRLPLEIPQGAFAELAQLGNEMRQGGRSPEGRTASASVITGRGVQEMNAGFDSQIKTLQDGMSETLTDVLALCFEMDEVYWPKKAKTIRGTADDSPYEVTYVPAKDINGDYTVDVTYGFAAGMDPNRQMVTLLQMHGAGAISLNFLLRQAPFSMNVEEEFAARDVEDLRGAAKQAIAGLAAGLPQLMAQGQDPSQIIAKLGEVITLRQKGEQVEDALAKVFAPPPPTPPAPGGPAAPGEPATAPGAGAAAGALNPGVQPGQEALGPGGKPDLRVLMSRLTGAGGADSSVGMSQRMPA